MLNRWIERGQSILSQSVLVMTSTNRKLLVGMFSVGLLISPSAQAAEEPAALHERINRMMANANLGATSRTATDSEFLRRIYLDLVGRIPSADETRRFLDDPSHDKRSRLVDELLRRDEVNRHLAIVLDIWIMERRKDQHVTTEAWRAYLSDALATGKPFNQLVAEILTASGDAKQINPAAKFYLDRNVETHSVTRDISRVFFGRDIQCAQCHDHPLIADYLQSEYYGLFSFVSRSFLFQEQKNPKRVLIAEKSDGDAVYSSVFEPDAEKTTAVPALADGTRLYDEPLFVPGDGYRVAPAKDVAPVPKFSRREQLARLATTDRNQLFHQNIANRLWRHMLGRGLVEPPDLHHDDNPAAFPELLQALGDAFAQSGCDIKAFLREVALSDAYQRAIDIPDDDGLSTAALRHQLGGLNQRLTFQEAVVSRADEQTEHALDQLNLARDRLRQVNDELRAALDSLGQNRKARQEAAKALAKARDELAAKSNLASQIRVAAEAASKAVAQLADDQELAQSAKVLAARAEKITSEVTALEQQSRELHQAHEKCSVACGELEESLPLLNEQRAKIMAKVRGLHGEYDGVRRQRRVEGNLRASLEQQIRVVRKQIDLRTSLDEKRNIASRIEAVRADRQSLLSKSVQLESESDAIQSRLSETRNWLANQQQRLNQAQQQLDAHQTTLDAVQRAVEQSRLASQSLPDDMALQDALALLTSRLDELAVGGAELESKLSHIREAIDDRREQEANLVAQANAQQDRTRVITKQVSDLDAQSQQLANQLQESRARVDEHRSSLNRTRLERFAVATLRPLSPEELSRSLVQAIGLKERFRMEAEAEWQRNNKDKQPDELDPVERDKQIDELFKKRLAKVDSTFVQLFASSPGSPQDLFHATVDQALFFANDGRIRDWTRPAAKTLVSRLKDMTDDASIADELYLSVLCRRPQPDEINDVIGYLAEREDDRPAALQELVWSLVTSIEFRFK